MWVWVCPFFVEGPPQNKIVAVQKETQKGGPQERHPLPTQWFPFMRVRSKNVQERGEQPESFAGSCS